MFVAGPIGKADPSTHEAREKDYQALCRLDIISLAQCCVLCPPGLDFVKFCSCPVCAHKINILHDFEKEIKSKKKLITDYLVRVGDKEDLCMWLFTAAEWTKQMLDLLQENLKAVSENSEVQSELKKSPSAAKLVLIYQNMAGMLIKNGFFDKPEVAPEDDYNSRSFNVLSKINSGFFHYGEIKANDEVLALLGELKKLENDHINVKKTAEAHEKALDPSISRGYLKSQIELVERFPVEELQSKAEKLIDEVSPRDVHFKMFDKARACITRTCVDMILERKAFWCRSYSSGSTGSNEHSLNGLNVTLDLLIAQANSFRDVWEREYVPFFTPHDRSDPKKQRTEK